MATPAMFGPATQSVNFYQQAPEVATDLSALQRQRMLAQLLAQKGQDTPQGQMVGGHFVAPGALSYVNQLASALGGGAMNRDADAKESSLAQALMQKRQKDASDFMQAANGTPASTREVAGPAMEGQAAPTQTTEAVPGDMNKAIAIALQSQNPQLAGMAPDLMKRQMDAAELQQALKAAGISAPGGAGVPGAPAAPGAAPSGGAFLAPQGGIPGVDPRAMALTLSKNAQANKLGTMIQDANKPMAIAEGGTAYIPGQGAVFTAPKTEAGIGSNGAPIPGFQEAQARREGLIARARQGAESDNTMVTLDLPGGPKQMTRAQAIQLSQGGAQAPQAPAALPPGAVGNGAGPVNGQRVPSPMAPRPGDDDRTQIYSQERTNIAQQLQAAQQAGDQQAVARAQQDALALEKEIKSNRIPLPPMPVPGIALQDKPAQEYDAARAKDFAKAAADYQTGGRQAAGMARNFDTLEQLYKDPNVASGAAAESISNLKNLGQSLGIETKGLGAEQAVQSLTNKMALDLRSTADGGGMPGAMSDSDRNFLKALTPDLAKSPEGRAAIIDAGRKTAQRQQDIARMANDYERTNGRLDIGFDRQLQQYADQNRMFNGATPKAATSQAPDMKSLAAQELARRRAKAGG